MNNPLGVFEASVKIPWESIPNRCYLESPYSQKAGDGCVVKVASTTRQGGKLRHLVEVRGEKERNLIYALASERADIASYPVSRTLAYDVVEAPVCSLYRVLSSTSCFLIRESIDKDFLFWTVIAEKASVAKALMKRLRGAKVKATLVSLDRVRPGNRLTERQEQVLKHALREGFFDTPHSTSVRKLARELDCSPSTLVRSLRQAENKVLLERFSRA